MNLLLDSHVIIWCAQDNELLSAEAKKAIADTNNDLFVSVAGICELYLKVKRGNLKLQVDLRQILDDAEYAILDMTLDDAELAAGLPYHHGDPFDRMMIAQALNKNLVFVSADAIITNYNVPLLKA